MATWLVSGCATQRGGVLQDLPDPVFGSPKRPRIVPLRAVTVPPPRPRPAQVRPSAPSGWWPPGGIRDRWECIVVHHSATSSGDAAQFDKAHRQRGWDELGYHFVIGNGSGSPDGSIEVGSRWLNQKHGAHCKTPDNFYNQQGIGICLVGNLEVTPPTRAQMDSLTRLVRFLAANCHIPANRIYTHGGVTGKTLCPGRYFDLATLKRML